jgi:NAD(P)H-hydrate epimerase
LLRKFPKKKWVIDAGSLQVMDAEWIPNGAVLTPNIKEFEMLFKVKIQTSNIKIANENAEIVREKAKDYNCTIVLKGSETFVCSPNECVAIDGGNAGLTKGGTGDVLAGLTVALMAKSDNFLAAASASYIAKRSAHELFEKVGVNYNSDDLAAQIPVTFNNL